MIIRSGDRVRFMLCSPHWGHGVVISIFPGFGAQTTMLRYGVIEAQNSRESYLTSSWSLHLTLCHAYWRKKMNDSKWERGDRVRHRNIRDCPSGTLILRYYDGQGEGWPTWEISVPGLGTVNWHEENLIPEPPLEALSRCLDG